MNTDVLPPSAETLETSADSPVGDTTIDLHRAAELIMEHRQYICLRELPDTCDTHVTARTLAETILRQTGEVRKKAHAKMAQLVRGLRLLDQAALFTLQDDDNAVL
ncbi:MAG: hypothetical protein O2904_01755 [bacterium]|nr:hypothetical protein [bacterium]